MGVRDAGARRRPEVLEHEHVAQPGIGRVHLGHPFLVGQEQVCEVLLPHRVQADRVVGVVDDDLVPPVAVDDLLEPEGDVALLAVVA